MYCRKCGTENRDEAKFCKKCGSALNEMTNAGSEKHNTEAKKKKSLIWIIVLIFIILAALIIGVSLAVKNKEEKSRQEYVNCLTEAEKYLTELDYENAEAMYLMAIDIEPKYSDPYIKLADIYLLQEKYAEAVEILEKAEKNAEDSENKSQETGISVSDKKEEIKNRGEYTWVVEPTIEADDINYVTDEDYSKKTMNGINLQFISPYAVIRQGESLGLINLDGEMIGNLDYKWIGAFHLGWSETYILERTTRGIEGFTTYYLEGDTVEPALGLGGGDPCCYSFYWCNGLHHVDEYYSWGGDVKAPSEAIPVRMSEELYQGQTESNYLWWRNLQGGYAVCKDGQLITDFIYDKCGSYSEGLFAVCKDNKWGYINEEGEIVIPIEYDSSWKKNIEQYYIVFGEEAEKEDFCYAASGGYIPLVKDGKWELRDISGKLIILPGVFEEIRPVYDGKCWVKKNGLWGVVELESESQSKEGDTKEKTELDSAIYHAQYEPILLETQNQYQESYGSNYYYCFDIDKDGVKELMVQTGTCEADYMYQIYTIREIDASDGKTFEAVYLGEVSGFHSSFYADENGGTENYIIRSSGHMGYGYVYHVFIQDGKVVEQEISSNDNAEYYANEYLLPSLEVSNYSLLN